MQERIANQLNDWEISPTNYMNAFLRQRGWKLPANTVTIPNVIPEVEPAAAAVRLCFLVCSEQLPGCSWCCLCTRMAVCTRSAPCTCITCKPFIGSTALHQPVGHLRKRRT